MRLGSLASNALPACSFLPTENEDLPPVTVQYEIENNATLSPRDLPAGRPEILEFNPIPKTDIPKSMQVSSQRAFLSPITPGCRVSRPALTMGAYPRVQTKPVTPQAVLPFMAPTVRKKNRQVWSGAAFRLCILFDVESPQRLRST